MHFRPRCVWVVVFIHLRMETPLCGRSGGHTGTAPYGFVWADCAWVGFVCLLGKRCTRTNTIGVVLLIAQG